MQNLFNQPSAGNDALQSFSQTVLHDNEEIIRCIKTELANARSQVLVVTAWFTNPDLFQCLVDAAARGINVRVIMADIDDNRKLDFDRLQQFGALIYRIPQSGYGGMRQRFCIIDQRNTIHGSFNWTINASFNTQESVIVTNHAGTVNQLVDQFRELEQQVTGTGGGSPVTKPARETLLPAAPEAPDFREAYTHVLKQMIAAEVSNFDRDLLRQQGYERAEANNGDPQVLHSALDIVYSLFINDINTVEDKKKRLIGKINEQLVIHNGLLLSNSETQLRTIESGTETTRQEMTARIANLKVRADGCRLDITNLNDQQLPAAEANRQETAARIRQLERDRIVPRFKWYEFIPVLLLGIGLLCYLVLFYSSAIYILLFSETDAKIAILNGLPVQPPQVFEPYAFTKIIDRGAYALSFIALFVFLPLTMSVVGKLNKESYLGKGWMMITVTLLLDTLIAYKVAATIYHVEILTGNVQIPWRYSMILTDPNFYLVFVLGSLGLVIFNALFGKLFSLFEERNPDVLALQQQRDQAQEEETLEKNRVLIAELKEKADKHRKELAQLVSDSHLLELELAGLPHKRALAIAKCNTDLENSRKVLSDVTAIYIARIENDVLPISIDAMKDRIGVFLEGWINFLNNEYAEAKAVEKSRQAIEATTIWQQHKLVDNRIDHRIKTL